MTKKTAETEYTDDEVARRRDEVIRRMANTPPRPRANRSRHPQKAEKADADRAADKGRADRGD